MEPRNLLAIVGPTGVGKTAAAVTVAQRYGCELISADSRQVYLGMDIATGKEVAGGEWLLVNGRRTFAVEGIFIHGMDLVEPDQEFSVFDWVKITQQIMMEIADRGRLPLVVGGTGFYLDGLQGKITTLSIPPDQQLRQSLAGLPVAVLQQRLAQIQQDRLGQMNASDRQNPARLVRAIEVASSQPRNRQSLADDEAPTHRLHLVGLTMDRERLYQQVDGRIEAMLNQGLLAEVERLVQRYGRLPLSMTGIGYQELADHLAGELSLDEAVSRMKQRTRQYIKRQYTWFNRQPLTWIDVGQDQWQRELFGHIDRLNIY